MDSPALSRCTTGRKRPCRSALWHAEEVGTTRQCKTHLSVLAMYPDLYPFPFAWVSIQRNISWFTSPVSLWALPEFSACVIVLSLLCNSLGYPQQFLCFLRKLQVFVNQVRLSFYHPTDQKWARGDAVGWGTALQVWSSRVRFPMVSMEFFIDTILPAVLWPWGWLSL